MHRFDSVQHLARHTDGRHEYFNRNHPSVPTTHPNQGFVGRPGMSSSHQGTMSGKLNQPIPRMPSFHGPGSSSMEGGNPSCPSSIYNNYRSNMPYHQGGSGMMEGMGYLAQKRNSQMMASGHYGSMGATAEGYGGANRFHPYQSQIQHQAPPPQPPQPQPQRSGFLEQLLKNRGGNHQPYGRSSMGMPPSTLNSYPAGHPGGFRGNGQPDWNNYYQGMTYGPGGGGGRTGSYIPPHHQPPQWGRGNIGRGAFQPYAQHLNNGANYNYPSYQNNYSNLHQNSPFNHSRHQQQHLLPVIRNEPEEEGTPSAQEQADADIRKSETRFRKNHERMHSILNETMANCDPIEVPMSRVDTLRRHVQLLNDDVSKHKEDTDQVKDHCAKRLQDFKDSTTKFHSDYKKLCQPIEPEEYDALVDKYYNEFKDNLKKKQNAASTSSNGTDGAELGVDLNVGPEDDYVFMKQEVHHQNKVSDEEVPSGDSNNNQADYYENPLFIDIPPESEPRFEESAYPTPHINQSAPDSCYSGVHGLGQHQPQQQMADCMYYEGGGNHGDLLMTVQQPATQPMRWNHNENPSVNNFGHMPTQREHYNVEEEGFPIHHHSHPQAASMLRHLRQNRQTRPSEELREFVKGLVIAQAQKQGQLRNDLLAQTRHHHQQVPQLQPEVLPIEQHPCAQDVPEGQGHVQQRRLMSGGGIVEVKYSPPHPGTSQSTIYDDAATREWINSLTTSVSDESHCVGDGNIEVDGSQQEVMREGGLENDEYNNMDNPIGIGESPLSNSGSQGSGSLMIGKNSKLAEILESPCLNDNNDEEFESELRQLEDALNGNTEDICKTEAIDGDCSEVDEGELIEGQENND